MRKILLWTLLVMLAACSPLKDYRQSPEVKAWEPEIRRFEHLDSTSVYGNDAILFVGSSSIRLWFNIAADMAPYPVIQRGFGGSKLSDVATYAKRIIYPHPCRAVVFFVANDITGSESDKTPEEVARLAAYVVKTVHARFPGTPVFWISTTPTASRWQVWEQIKQANALIEKLEKRDRNFHYIATEQAFLNDKGMPREELFLTDRLHLNRDGYAIWAALIKAELNSVLGN
jgi:lysophospholipase L1-like esterase